jgi:8-amino-7-oxononanoate synthase
MWLYQGLRLRIISNTLPCGAGPSCAGPPLAYARDVPLDRDAQDDVDALEGAGLLRSPRTAGGPQGPELDVEGRRILGFCSNDYLGLAGDPRLTQAAAQATKDHGVGSGASRLISGQHTAHRDAEARLARFVAADAALLFSTGYAANVGLLPALCDRRDVIFSDALNHASLIDGCRLSRARVRVYRHRDLDHLRALLRSHRPKARRALIVTDALFSMDGDRAPVAALRQLADPHDAALIVDEAHALGVLGPGGRGVCADAGVRPDVLVGTLGKAFGVAGAFVAASKPVIRLLENRARSYVFSTAPPPAQAATIVHALDMVTQADDRRAHVLSHARRLRRALTDQGWRVVEGDSPIVPVLIGPDDLTMRLSAELFERGIFVQGIRPPTVPAGTSRLRIVPMATHTPAHLDQLISAMHALRPLALPAP